MFELVSLDQSSETRFWLTLEISWKTSKANISNDFFIKLVLQENPLNIH